MFCLLSYLQIVHCRGTLGGTAVILLNFLLEAFHIAIMLLD